MFYEVKLIWNGYSADRSYSKVHQHVSAAGRGAERATKRSWGDLLQKYTTCADAHEHPLDFKMPSVFEDRATAGVPHFLGQLDLLLGKQIFHRSFYVSLKFVLGDI